jgi:hypothetical protein
MPNTSKRAIPERATSSSCEYEVGVMPAAVSLLDESLSAIAGLYSRENPGYTPRMSVPGSFMLPLLGGLADGQEHDVRELRDQIAAEFKLTPQDRAELLPSGKQTLFDNRVGWAKTYFSEE